MTTQTTTQNPGDNLAPAIDQLKATLRKQGEREANGEIARPTAALAMAHSAHAGEIDESFAEVGYSAYLAGKRKAAGQNPMVATDDDTGKTFDVQVSKFRQCIKVSMIPAIDGPDLLGRALTIGQTLRSQGTKTKSPFDGMLEVARAQIKDPSQPLTDEQIADLVTVRKAERPELADLVAAYKTAHKLAEKYPTTGAADAIGVYRRAIIEAGGEVPPVTETEKKAAEAMAFLRSQGMVAIHAIAAQ